MTFILPGSLEIENHAVVIAGVHSGPSEYEVKDLRYVSSGLGNMKTKETLIDFVFRIYKNSTGCLIKQTFKINDNYNVLTGEYSNVS